MKKFSLSKALRENKREMDNSPNWLKTIFKRNDQIIEFLKKKFGEDYYPSKP